MYPLREGERGDRDMDGSSGRDYRGMGSLLSTDEDSNLLMKIATCCYLKVVDPILGPI